MLGLLPSDLGALVSVDDPRLAPDGAHVAYGVLRVDLEHNRYHGRVWVAAADGSVPPAPRSPEDVTATLPRWSPNGRSLAYAARPLDDDDAPTELRVAPAFGDGEHRVIARWREAPRELEWSPDGTRLAYVARDPDPERYG